MNKKTLRAGIRICYEAQFPEYFRELFLKRADLCLVSFAHTGSAEQSYKYEVEKSHLVSRACENALYILSVNSLPDSIAENADRIQAASGPCRNLKAGTRPKKSEVKKRCQLSPTCLINPDGRIMGTAPKEKEYLLTGEIIIEKPDFGRKGRIYYSKLLTK